MHKHYDWQEISIKKRRTVVDNFFTTFLHLLNRSYGGQSYKQPLTNKKLTAYVRGTISNLREGSEYGI